MQNSLSDRDYSLSLIRLLSTTFIVSCHIMQYLSMTLAWWFNVGVQIFLCLSGYLYGKKEYIKDIVSFYKKQFFKILLDYYIVLIPIIVLTYFFKRDSISSGIAIRSMFLFGTVRGGEHLWYIPYCLFCYFLTPIFLALLNNILSGKDNFKIILKLSIFITINIILFEKFLGYFNSAWMLCYILGLILGKLSNHKERKNLSDCLGIVIIILSFLMNAFQIFHDYIFSSKIPEWMSNIYPRFRNYAHVALGISLFLLMKLLFSKIFRNGYSQRIVTVCTYSDRLSYDIYLTHQFIILGPFSLMSLTDNLAINIMLIIISILFSAVAVNTISRFTKSKIEKLISRSDISLDISSKKDVILTYNSIDLMKFIMSIVVIAIHTNPFLNCENKIVLKIYSGLASFAIPFFFIASGFLLGKRFGSSNLEKCRIVKNSVLRIIKLYLVWSVVYFPLAAYSYVGNQMSFIRFSWEYVKGFLFVGEHYNSWPLWYLLSSIYTLLIIWSLLKRNNKVEQILLIGFSIFVFGNFITWSTNYVGENSFVRTFAWIIQNTIINRRILGGLFYIPLGLYLAENEISTKYNILLLFEGFFLLFIGVGGDIPLVMCSIGLFGLVVQLRLPDSKMYIVLRKMSTSIYLIHMWVWSIYYYLVYGKKTFGVDSFFMTVFMSILVSTIYIFMTYKMKNKKVLS